jgi:hypothetical protein
LLVSFMKKNQERLSEFFLAKLKNVPRVAGKPDFSEMGDPQEVAKQWLAEAALTQEDLLGQLLAVAENERNTKT